MTHYLRKRYYHALGGVWEIHLWTRPGLRFGAALVPIFRNGAVSEAKKDRIGRNFLMWFANVLFSIDYRSYKRIGL